MVCVFEKLFVGISRVVFTDAQSFPPSHHGFLPADPTLLAQSCAAGKARYMFDVQRLSWLALSPIELQGRQLQTPIGGLLPAVTPCLSEFPPKVPFFGQLLTSLSPPIVFTFLC